MKWLTAFLFVLTCISYASLHSAAAQTFTRITTGDLVLDGGASRSVNWVDVNGDGLTDLFVTNGLETGEDNFLYINNGPDSGYTFTKIIGDPIVSDNAKSDGSSWGDIDNDGDLDAFVVNWYGDDNLLYRNNGDGTFVQAVGEPPVTDGGYSETCSWGDYDNDGDLDLYVTNSGYSVTGPLANFLYTNLGDGTLTKVTTGSIVTDLAYSRGANWIDYDADGDLDMFVTNERNQANQLYQNRLIEDGIPEFERVVTGSIVTDLASSWSGSWGDFDNDGDQDVFVTNGWPNGQNDFLYENNGDATFTRITTGPVVTDAAFSATGGWGDYDNDGDLDLFVTTAYSGSPTANRLYQNQLAETGSPTFERILEGDIVNDLGDSYGFAWEDYNQDGFLDLFAARTQNENQDNVLYRNDATNGNHWLKVHCTGTASNRSGIGATVRVRAIINGSPVWQSRTVEGQSGYCGQSLTIHFGLGDATQADSIEVLWPSGTSDVFTNVPVDIPLPITEGETVSVDESGLSIPNSIRLYPNYPNPFNPSTSIRFDMARSGYVRLDLYDILGRHVAELVAGVRPAGNHIVSVSSSVVKSSGVYTYVLSAGSEVESRQLIYLK